MKSDRIMKSKVYRFLDYILRLVILNAFIVIPSFSLFIIYSIFVEEGNNPLEILLLIPAFLWLFPSIVAVTDVIRQYENDETNTILKDFIQSIKKVYLKSLIESIFIYIGITLFWNSLTFFLNNFQKGALYVAGFFLSLSFAIGFCLVVIQIPLVNSYFSQIGLIDSFKLSFIYAFKDIAINFLILVIVLVFSFLNLMNNYVMALLGFSLPIYFMVKLSFKQYIKTYRKVEKDEN